MLQLPRVRRVYHLSKDVDGCLRDVLRDSFLGVVTVMGDVKKVADKVADLLFDWAELVRRENKNTLAM